MTTSTKREWFYARFSSIAMLSFNHFWLDSSVNIRFFHSRYTLLSLASMDINFLRDSTFEQLTSRSHKVCQNKYPMVLVEYLME